MFRERLIWLGEVSLLLGADCPVFGGWLVMESDFQATPLQVPRAKMRVAALTGTEPVLEV